MFQHRAVLPFALLLFSYLFFLEYLPPVRAVHIPYDLEGYHYSLANYAFQALRSGRFPQWDPTQYCGMPFAANVNAALFYPPLWLLYLASWRHRHLPFAGLEILTLAHVPLAFLLCFGWLRGRALAPLAAVFGAGVFAFSGYLLLQLQHFGLVCGYAWLPLGLVGIDRAVAERHWRPLWRLAAASALCFLAGYTPFWVAFAAIALAYSLAGPWRARAAAGVLGALAVSLLLSLVQLLPALELTRLKQSAVSYGAGIRDPLFYLSYLAPNFFNFSLRADVHTNFGKEYLYLGAPAVFGLLCLLRRHTVRDLLPSLAVALLCLAVVTNPFDLIWKSIEHSVFLRHVLRSYYFLGGLTLAAASLSAAGIDDFLRRRARPVPPWLALTSLAALALWSLRLLGAWLPSGAGFAFGPASFLDPAVMLVLFALGLSCLRGQQSLLRTALAAALVLATGVDYKVFGTSKRFNAAPGATTAFDATVFPALNPDVFQQFKAHPAYRIALDPDGGPQSWELRHFALPTPQGMDPFLSRRYEELTRTFATYNLPWRFVLDPANQPALRLLGVRYFITSVDGPQLSALAASPSFRLLDPSPDYYKVFELIPSEPAFGIDSSDASARAACLDWLPERRSFLTRSSIPARFHLSEQFYPGWRASIDGVSVPIQPWSGAFQAVDVPAGEHRVQFRFASVSLAAGAAGSLLSLVILGAALFVTRSRRKLD